MRREELRGQRVQLSPMLSCQGDSGWVGPIPAALPEAECWGPKLLFQDGGGGKGNCGAYSSSLAPPKAPDEFGKHINCDTKDIHNLRKL